MYAKLSMEAETESTELQFAVVLISKLRMSNLLKLKLYDQAVRGWDKLDTAELS